jgi:hypothetical protein
METRRTIQVAITSMIPQINAKPETGEAGMSKSFDCHARGEMMRN